MGMTCTWEADTECLGTTWDGYTPEVQERALMLATSALQSLTLNRVGTCPITIRPCPNTVACGCSFWPHMEADGRWYNNCGHRSPCTPLGEIDLPGPVGYIDSLKIDGSPVTLDDGDWRLDNGHLLVWQGAGESPIPTTQDLNKPDTEPGTWSITYSQSYPVALDGRIAVGLLAAEMAKACAPKGKCSLPRGVTSVVRNGVSFTLEAGLFPNGLTGIDLTDQFILKWVPAGTPNRTATVFTPRDNPPRRTSMVPMRTPIGSA